MNVVLLPNVALATFHIHMVSPLALAGDGYSPHTRSNAVLTVDNLSKRFGAFWALRGASFSIRPREILGLIGPNGSGKSTLFHCLAGIAPATLGTVSVDGSPVAAGDRKNILYFVPDGIRPWPDQTVGWVLAFVSGLHGAPRSAPTDIMRALALEPLRGARLHELSKGEHRRVLLAIGMLTPQSLLMLDEPFDGLDLRQTRDVMSVLKNAAASGRTLFLSIHQLGDAGRICDRLVLLSSGEIVGEGTLDELRAKAKLASGGLEEVFLALT
jgi:ABC-2 type transport system ATP-binding protein